MPRILGPYFLPATRAASTIRSGVVPCLAAAYFRVVGHFAIHDTVAGVLRARVSSQTWANLDRSYQTSLSVYWTAMTGNGPELVSTSVSASFSVRFQFATHNRGPEGTPSLSSRFISGVTFDWLVYRAG